MSASATVARAGPGRWGVAGLAAILLLSAVLRVHELGRESLWTDEFHSLFATTGRGAQDVALAVGVERSAPFPPPTSLQGAPGWWRVWGAANGNPHGNPHPPLFFLLLRTWRAAFGDAEAALRSLSVVAGLVAILLLYETARQLGGTAPATWAAVVMAVAPIQVYYAREVRGYALALALALGAAASYARMVRLGPTARRAGVLALTALGCALTHYFAIGALLAIGAHAGLATTGAVRRRSLAALGLAGLVFVAAWGPFFLHLHGVPAQGFPGFADPAPGHPLRTLARVAGLPLVHLQSSGRWAVQVPIWGAAVFLAALLRSRRRPDLAFWLCWSAGTIGLVAVHDLANETRQLDLVRFAVFAAPATYVLLAGTAASFRSGWVRHGLPALAVAVALAGLPAAYEPSRGPWRELAQAIAQATAEGDLVVVEGAHHPAGVGAGVAANVSLEGILHYADLRGRRVLLADSAAMVLSTAARESRLWLVSNRPRLVGLEPATAAASQVFVGDMVPELWRIGARPGQRLVLGAGASGR